MSAIATLEPPQAKIFTPKGLIRLQYKSTFSTRIMLHFKHYGCQQYLFYLYDHGDLLSIKETDIPVVSFVFDAGTGPTVLTSMVVQLPIHEFIGKRVAIGDQNGQIVMQGIVAHSAPFDFDTVNMDLEWRSCSRNMVYR